jgi:hypothetical protein
MVVQVHHHSHLHQLKILHLHHPQPPVTEIVAVRVGLTPIQNVQTQNVLVVQMANVLVDNFVMQVLA